MLTMQKAKEEKTKFTFLLPKQLDKEWRRYIAEKYDGFYKGCFSNEVELAIRHFMDEYRNDRK